MDKYKINPKAKEINIKSRTKKEFLLFHGYTGSPSDFNMLPRKLNEKFNASVRVILLKGHGTHVSELNNYLFFDDYIEQAEKELMKSLNAGRNVILGGYSFGGQIALYLASKYGDKIEGVFSISTPYPLSFFLSTKPMTLISKMKKEWKKPLSKTEVDKRNEAFYYEYMPGHTLEIIRQGVKKLKKTLHNIKAPLFLVNSKNDIWIPNRSVKLLMKHINSEFVDYTLIEHKGHSLFYSVKQNEVYSKIIKFLKKIKTFNS